MAHTQPHGSDLRKGRWSETSRIYLATFVTKGRSPVFQDLKPARIVVQCLMKARNTDTLAYVIMPDHVHWLLQLQEDSDLSLVVQAGKSISARKINRLYQTKGQFWQSGFHDHAIRREEDLKGVARYIVANPLRAGLVESVGDYSFWDAVWL